MLVGHVNFKFLCNTTNQIVKNCKDVNKSKREFYIDGKWYGELKIGKQEMY